MISAVCQDGMQKQIKNKKKLPLCRVQWAITLGKGPLCRVSWSIALGKAGPSARFLPNSQLCRVPGWRHSAKNFPKKKFHFFAECLSGGHSAKNFF